MKLKSTLAILSFAALPFTAVASGSSPDISKAIDPGLWETTVQMQMTGVPMQLGAHSVKHCITQAELDKYKGMPPPQNTADMSCSTPDYHMSGNTMTYTMKCTGTQGDMTMKGSTILDSRDANHGTMTMTGTMQGHPMRMTSNYTSKRVGDCSAPAPGSGG
ncbi:MAG: DUF3617 domain-containing protein [Gammaproteobacteria bacterium]